MTKPRFFFAALLALLLFFPQLRADDSLCVMSYNVLTSYDGKVNGWDERKGNLAADIKQTDPDLLGLQEACKNQLDDILTSLDGYSYTGVGRDDGAEGGEYCPVLYKTSKFELLDSGTFWLSETPDLPGKKGWGAACNRIVSWGKFRSKEDGFTFVYANTHFDHISEKAREESSKLILQFREKTAGDLPFLITGDFNSEETDQSYKTIVTGLQDARKIAGNLAGGDRTFPSPMHKREKGCIIDYIFVSDHFEVDSFSIHSDPLQKDPYPSDHFSIDAKLIRK